MAEGTKKASVDHAQGFEDPRPEKLVEGQAASDLDKPAKDIGGEAIGVAESRLVVQGKIGDARHLVRDGLVCAEKIGSAPARLEGNGGADAVTEPGGMGQEVTDAHRPSEGL